MHGATVPCELESSKIYAASPFAAALVTELSSFGEARPSVAHYGGLQQRTRRRVERKATMATKTPTRTAAKVWTDEERAAMQASVQERKAASRRDPAEERAAGEAEVQAKIAEMPGLDRQLGTRIHKLVLDAAPTLVPRTYYGMPAWAKDGKVICFFKPASKFKVRYATFEFQPDATLDDGEMWPVSFALTKLTSAVEKRIVGLVKQATR